MLNKVCGLWSWWWEAGSEEETLLTTILTIAVTIFTVLWLSWNIKKPKKAIAPLPPGPCGLPFLGYLPFLGMQLHKKFTELAGVYGPIYKLWLANKLYVVVSSPSLVREIVRDKDIIFADRDPPIAVQIFTYGGNDIAWSSYGPQWKKMRKVFVHEMLSNASLEACYELRKQEVKKAIRDTYNKIGNPIDIGELAFRTATNVILRMVAGGTLQGEKWANFVAELRKLAAEMVAQLGKPNVSDLFPVLARFDLQSIQRDSRRILMCLEQILNSVIEQRLSFIAAKEVETENGEQRKDFLQILLDLNKHEDTETSITMNELKAMLLDIVIGGTETTSTMIEWTMSELMLHQEVMEKVYKELEEVVGANNNVEEFHLSKLPYLHAVMKETFRLHPALPLLVPRFAKQSCIVGGFTIPKGTTVSLNVYAIHRDPNLWDNPLEFRPERFLNQENNKFDYLGNSSQYFPFGSGRRVCAGLPLAEKMLMSILASLLHSFDWKLSNGTKLDLSPNFGFVMKKMKPLIIIPTPRLSNLELY